ncbi:glycosyltransferase [Bacillus niameyensis]|uniref:glycosyltransferase n=1 Tax=Bacillus niameyensis TaxID=1522308 RepID=UPI000783169B|nr:glycosyltransferase [Bacillus niameyensis]
MDIQSIQRRLETINKLKEKVLIDIDAEKKAISDLHSFLKTKKKAQLNNTNTKPNLQSKKVEKKQPDPEELEKKIAYLKVRDKLSDVNFFETVKPLLDQLPDSNGSRYYDKIKTNIGIIADEFLFNSFKGTANFFYIERDNFKKHKGKLDVLLIATAWKGLNFEWKGLGNPKIKRHRQDLYKIIDFYRSQGTKIVFYSKEDPVNYEVFIDIAKQCDYIFTTAEEKVESYKKDCKNDKVFLLEFGVNPLYHNPVGIKKFPKQKEVLFAGSWYNKYPHRQKDTRMIFDGIIDANKSLKIIDRNYDFKLAQYFFPEEYLKYVSPAVQHEYLQKMHKIYNWAINLNSIQESNTMFANRIYELQALGNILLSNYSVGVNNKFPNVYLIHDKNEIREIFESMTEEEIFEHQVYGIRRVMTSETTFQRVNSLLEKVGIDSSITSRKVAVLVKEKTEQINRMFESQTYSDKKLFTEDEFTEKLKSNYDFITFFAPSKYYGEFYLEDMVNGFKYTNSDYVTKSSYYNGNKIIQGTEFDYVDLMEDKSRTLFWSSAFTLNQLKDFNGKTKLLNGFSIDRFNFNEVRNEKVKAKKNYQLSVIVPTYNNGEHLLNKCFNSLKRSSMFEDMEIIIVDDGSTDEKTPKIVKYLEGKFNNVRTYFYNDGGSGSASRPRNKGFELTSSPYITYLDPDNEAINDGYTQLYKQVVKGKHDMAIGNMLRIDTKPLNFDYYKTAMQFYGGDTITKNVKEYLVNTQFKAMSIQALIVKREVIGNNSLKMVEGAVGQDTIFFQELLLNSSKTKVINVPIHVYYAAVSGSAVNTITKKFFEKYLKLEKYRYKMLKENNLLDEYIEKRFEYYFENWYLKKLKLVVKEDVIPSVQLLGDILTLYENDYHKENTSVDQFLKLFKLQNINHIIKQYIE